MLKYIHERNGQRMEQKAYLTLENGDVFEGYSFGAQTETTGELVFTTAMTGYLETLTDPSYYGQIVCQTFLEWFFRYKLGVFRLKYQLSVGETSYVFHFHHFAI